MTQSAGITRIARLLSDPTRSLMLTALMDGRALTVTELARSADITLQTASEHLSKLQCEQLLATEKQGRHRYYRLANLDVAALIETLMSLSNASASASRVATGPREMALRGARVCYDHLAGQRGVAMLDGLKRNGWIVGEDELTLSESGSRFLHRFGIEVETLRAARRPMCRACLDWSERRTHLAGALGAALFERLLALRWIERCDGRVIAVSKIGEAGFAQTFG